MSVPVGHLKSLSHNSAVYIDDSYLQRVTYQACYDYLSDTIKLLRVLCPVLFKQKNKC